MELKLGSYGLLLLHSFLLYNNTDDKTLLYLIL